MESRYDRMSCHSYRNSKEEKNNRRKSEIKRLIARGHTKKFAKQAAKRI
nr:hypothetical protein SUGSMm_09110 [Morganella morganii subsp. sibonii]